MQRRKLPVFLQSAENGFERASRVENNEIAQAFVDGEAAAESTFGKFGEILKEQKGKKIQ